MYRIRPGVVAAFVICLLLPACAGSREVGEDRPDAPAPAERTPVTRTVQGFRIQIHNTDRKGDADAYVAQALDWWADLPASRRPPYLGEEGLDVEVDWRQPYYRVRMGSFATRAEAERALRVVTGRFPDALIVPDTVTVTR